MNQPHFSNSLSAMSTPINSRHRRRFRGNYMFDCPGNFMDDFDQDIPYVPSVKELCRMMRDQPDISQKRLAEIRRKLESGTYLNRSTAEQTARLMVDEEIDNA